MKKIHFIIPFVLALLITACSKDYLDRQPLGQVSPDAFFKSENDLQLYINSLYTSVPSGEGIYGENADNIVKNALTAELTGLREVPVSGGGWDWAELRKINYFLDNSNKFLSSSITTKYAAEAKFFRAYFYFGMVKRFGDVPWYSHVIAVDDDESLNKPRDPRTLVMDSVLKDIDYAIANLGTAKSNERITRWTALALKSRICLFEGTFRKYHTEFNLPDANKFLEQSAEAASRLMAEGSYTIHKSSPAVAYQEVFTSAAPMDDEVILAVRFSAALQIYHSFNYYTLVPSQGKSGLDKQLVDSYLMKDGTPFTNQPNYGKMQFFEEMQNRDPRLAQTIRTPGYTRMGNTMTLVPDFGATVTGYQPIKFLTSPAFDSSNRNVNALPVIRFAEVLLNFAEAKAELGTLTQNDLDRSINQIRSRVTMPQLNLAMANASPDAVLAGQYTHVTGGNKGAILEVRRERRIELVMENFRWDDLMRWKEGHLLARQFKGMYFPGTGNFDFDHDGKIDAVIYEGTKPAGSGPQFFKLSADIILENNASGGPVLVNPQVPKKFNEDRDYLFPIPTQEILLNTQLTQNPGWK